MTDIVEELEIEFPPAPEGGYPQYHFQRTKGERVHILVEGEDWGVFDLETMDNEVKDSVPGGIENFIFREAIEFLIAERR